MKSQTTTSAVTIYKKNEEQTNLPGHLSILSHLTTNATYYIRVSAVNGQGEGPASDISVVIVRPGGKYTHYYPYTYYYYHLYNH